MSDEDIFSKMEELIIENGELIDEIERLSAKVNMYEEIERMMKPAVRALYELLLMSDQDEV